MSTFSRKASKGLKIKEDLVIRETDKPKLRQSLINTLEHCGEAKAIAREKFLRELVTRTSEYCASTGQPPIKERFGKFNVRRIPAEILDELSAADFKVYCQLLRDLAATELSVMRVIDPFDVSKSATALKEATKATDAQSFEDLILEAQKRAEDD